MRTTLTLDDDSPVHGPARRWWDGCLAGTEGVGLAWVVMLGFVRITTHSRILLRPLTATWRSAA